MIECKIYHCRMTGSDLCCTYCDRRSKCLNRCENHPDRCGVWREGGEVKRRSKPHCQYDPKEIVALYKQGLTCEQVAEKIGCGLSTVSLALRRAGETSRHGRGPIIDYDMVWQLHEIGLTNKEIARRVGCSEASVSIILHRKGRREHE